MTSAPAPTPAAFEPSPTARDKPPARRLAVALGIVLVLAVVVAGSPELDAPWMIGDEFIFIVSNPDVNPAAEPGRSDVSLPSRLRTILTKIHGDLYQPISILTYAVEWELSRGEGLSFRCTDLLLHALNALLLWWVLRSLLRRLEPPRAVPVSVIAWALALLWALHPALVTTYASDMGRTHLLSALFALVALGLHLRALASGRELYFVGSIAALLLAMLSKAIVGWVVLILVLEVVYRGWRPALTSPRIYLVGLICAAFAGLTLWTSTQSGLREEAFQGLFGDLLSRSALAIWIYFRSLVAPFWLAFWYLPDPKTGWTHPLVWAGLALALASGLHAAWSWRRSRSRAVLVGWAWCWALLLPVIGLVGAREAAAVDRYLYQPLMGVLLVLGVVLIRGLASLKSAVSARSERLILPVAGVLALLLLLWDLPQCRVARSPIRRAKRVMQLNPGDPRALEGLAVAYDFARNNPLPAADLESVPEGMSQLQHFHRLWLETLTQAADSGKLADYFPDPDDRGPFHRRLSYRFLRAGDPQQSLAQAQAALQFQPDEFATWKRLAHAYEGLGRFAEAAEAYKECEQRLPLDPLTRAVHFTDYGCLLMFKLERDAEACPEFMAAFASGNPPLPAKLGMALCQIRYGEGAAGFKLITEVLEADPSNVLAGLVLAEYHLRSHHWNAAAAVYDALIRDNPTNYAALRGFHEVCLQIGRPGDAVVAWLDASRQNPGRREFESYLVWSLALAAGESAPAAALELLEADPNNPLGCFALMLEAIRTGSLDEAVTWVQRARAGEPVPKAREFERAAAALQLLLTRKELPPEAVVPQAAVYLWGDLPTRAREEAGKLLDGYLATFPDSEWRELVERLRSELSDVKSAP